MHSYYYLQSYQEQETNLYQRLKKKRTQQKLTSMDRSVYGREVASRKGRIKARSWSSKGTCWWLWGADADAELLLVLEVMSMVPSIP